MKRATSNRSQYDQVQCPPIWVIRDRVESAASLAMSVIAPSGFKGVSWHIVLESGFEEKSSSWVSTVRQEKPRAYDYVAARVFGEFALTNRQLGLLKTCLQP
jgi:hypothetical protein